MIKIILIYYTLNCGNCTNWILLEYDSKNSNIELKNHYSGLMPKNKVNFGDETSLENIRSRIINDIMILIDNYEDNNDTNNLSEDKNEIKNDHEDKYKKKINNKEYITDEEDKYNSLNIIRKIKKVYSIGRVRRDGNCLFYALSYTTLGTDAYFNEIWTAICDYMEQYKNILDEKKIVEEKTKYIKKMRKNVEYGGYNEIKAFSILTDLKIICFLREITEKADDKYIKTKNDKVSYFTENESSNDEIALMFNVYKDLKLNHYTPLYKNKEKIIELSSDKIYKIKKLLNIINEEDKPINKKVISTVTGKAFGSRLAESLWKPYYPESRNKRKKEEIKYYTIDEYRINYKTIDEKNKLKVNEPNFTELNSIINEFNGKNFKEKGITYFKDNYHKVIINTIEINNKKINIESSDIFHKIFKEFYNLKCKGTAKFNISIIIFLFNANI